VTLTSPKATYDSLFLSNYATINIRDELSRLPGVGNVTVFGAGQYSMRVWLDPNKLYARNLMPQDVISAVQQQSQQVTAGQVGAPPAPAGQAFQYTLNVSGRLADTSEFENVIVKTGTSGDVTRVRDVGWVELGAQTYSQVFSLNNRPSTGIGVFQSPGANALEVQQAVEKKMQVLAKAFPQDVTYDTPFDTTKFVSESINEVYKTLIEAGLLVLVVILIFLQDWRAMLVSSAPLRRWRRSASPSISRPCLRSCSRSASWSTTPSWWSKAPRTISRRACPGTTPRSRRWMRCSRRSSASRWC
jgi:HAE1 family hydrophobic/amphiphilic exporter-1